MRIQSKSTVNDSQLLRAVTVKPASQSFGDVLAQSAKTTQRIAVVESLSRAVSGKGQSEENTRRELNRETSAAREKNETESTAKGGRSGKTTVQRARLVSKTGVQQKQSMNAALDEEGSEKVSAAQTEDDRKQGTMEQGSLQTSALRNDITGVAASPATDTADIEQADDAASNCTSTITPTDSDAQGTNSAQSNVQPAASKTDASAHAPEAQQNDETASAQPDAQADAAGEDMQAVNASAQSAEAIIGNSGIAVDFADLLPFAAVGPASVQTRSSADGTDGNKQGSVAPAPSAVTQENAGQSTALGMADLQSAANGVRAVSTSQASGNGTSEAHSNGGGNAATDQAGRHAQTDVSQATTTALHTGLASTLQTTTAQHIELRSANGSQASTAADATAQPTAANDESVAGQASGTSLAGMSGVSTARLIQTMGDSEMRVGIHSNEFGTISIRTTVTQQQMQAQIAVGHAELGTTLAAHIPSIQAKLGSEIGLQASIEVNANGSSFTGNGQHTAQQQTATTSAAGAEFQDAAPDVTAVQLLATADSTRRLDIRA